MLNIKEDRSADFTPPHVCREHTGLFYHKSFKCRFYPQTQFVSLNIDSFAVSYKKTFSLKHQSVNFIQYLKAEDILEV